MYLIMITYPVLLMALKAERWRKINRGDFKLGVYSTTIAAIMTLSWVWNLSRVELTTTYLLLSIYPLLLLFHHQAQKYEPEFTWKGYLSSHKYVVAILVVLIIGQLPMDKMIAKELLKSHEMWVSESFNEEKNIASLNEAILVQYDGEKRQYLENYKIEDLRIVIAGSTEIVFSDQWKQYDISIVYNQEGGRWVLKNLLLID